MDKWIIKYIWFVYFYVVKRTYKNYYEKVIKNNKDINISNYTFPIPNNWIWCSLSQISRQITDG
ncbi:hypothetical protein, partial [Mycoplasmopsis arginini]|uniref:hypothetical protein n=1 Tax=Mycoplasmopsis arginini TaxID=2094 RepID=UPI002962168B